MHSSQLTTQPNFWYFERQFQDFHHVLICSEYLEYRNAERQFLCANVFLTVIVVTVFMHPSSDFEFVYNVL